MNVQNRLNNFRRGECDEPVPPEQVVSRILFPHRFPSAGDDHSSMDAGCPHLVQPTGGLAGTLKRPLFGLAPGGVCRASRSPGNWCALTAPFHPYRRRPASKAGLRRGVLSVHFPSCRHDSMLWSTLPCGVRTFLRSAATGDRLTYSDRLWSSSSK